MYDFTRFEDEIFPAWLQKFRISQDGALYSWRPGGKASLYAHADAVFMNWILGRKGALDRDRAEILSNIHSFQDPRTGWYHKRYGRHHFKEHTAAYAVAALALLGESPRHPLRFLDGWVNSKAKVERWLRRNNWSVIWLGSHAISGIPAMLFLTQGADVPFFGWYFEWLDREVAPNSGFWERGLAHRVGLIRQPTKHEMAGAFHMFYIYSAFGRPWRFPERVIDQTLRLQNQWGLWDKEVPYGVDMDALYCLLRSQALAPGYRKMAIDQAVERYLQRASTVLSQPDLVTQFYPNTHRLVGTLNAIAEVQRVYPHLLKTTRNWRFSVDEVCYI